MSATPVTDFLDLAKKALQDARNNKQQLTLVIGKDDPDLDSIASAVILAYFRTAFPPKDPWSSWYIPIVNESRQVLESYPMLGRALRHASIDLHHLTTLEDLVVEGRSSGLHEDVTRFFFVDHNITLGRNKQNYSTKVIGCIDHNPDTNYVPRNMKPEPRIIVQSGSCTSLVVYFSRRSWEALQFETPDEEAALAKLGLAAILVDTENLTSKVTTEEDDNAVTFLLSRIKLAQGGQDFDRTNYYYEIIGQERPRVNRTIAPEPTPVAPVVVRPPPEPVVEMVPEPEPEPIVEPPQEEEVIPEPEPESRPEPVFIFPGFLETSPVALAQPKGMKKPEVVPEPEPAPVERPVTPPTQVVMEPITPIVSPRSAIPRVYLDEVLDHDFELGYEGGGAIGITFTRMSLAGMIAHAERDLVERAIEESASQSPGEQSPTKVMQGTPFTSAVRDFALKKGLSVYAIRTNISRGNELFIWVFAPSMSYYIPRFVQSQASYCKLEKWGDDEDVITREASGINQGMMAAYWLRKDPGRDAVKKALLTGTTYIFFGAPSPPPKPPAARRTRTNSSMVAI